jgi:hypothetical protein
MALAEWAPSWGLMSWQPEREFQRLHGTHVIALIHRQETTSLLGHPERCRAYPHHSGAIHRRRGHLPAGAGARAG